MLGNGEDGLWDCTAGQDLLCAHVPVEPWADVGICAFRVCMRRLGFYGHVRARVCVFRPGIPSPSERGTVVLLWGWKTGERENSGALLCPYHFNF